jgi:hypothetical protein
LCRVLQIYSGGMVIVIVIVVVEISYSYLAVSAEYIRADMWEMESSLWMRK